VLEDAQGTLDAVKSAMKQDESRKAEQSREEQKKWAQLEAELRSKLVAEGAALAVERRVAIEHIACVLSEQTDPPPQPLTHSPALPTPTSHGRERWAHELSASEQALEERRRAQEAAREKLRSDQANLAEERKQLEARPLPHSEKSKFRSSVHDCEIGMAG
jgi:hypothetical protein